MTYYYLQDSEVHLHGDFGLWETICEWKWSNATDAGRSHNNDMVDVVCQEKNHSTQIYTM